MTHACSFLDACHITDEALTPEDFESSLPRWCAGCGDFSVLTATRKLLAEQKLSREDVVFVSGIGCSSRFPHYMKTYGFHGVHGRALPVATGIKLARPELHVFVVMGDGDCCSIGAGHWIHAIRYNMNMVVLLLDNNIYALTKNQTSPTTPSGYASNTQPKGSFLPALNPLRATLGVTNASFVAQTADWMPSHLYATLRAAYEHEGFAFVRILQRCPVWTPDIFMQAVRKPDQNEVLVHSQGIRDQETEALYKNHVEHDPADIDHAHELARGAGRVRVGLFYRNTGAPRYDRIRELPSHTVEEKLAILESELDRHAL